MKMETEKNEYLWRISKKSINLKRDELASNIYYLQLSQNNTTWLYAIIL